MRYLLLFIICLNLYGDTKRDGLYYLNKLRESTGLNTFTENYELWKSSKNHSTYIKGNNIQITHVQKLNNLFSGSKPWDRTEYVGYNNRAVSENISGGIKQYRTSIDVLMTAIYHRFGFLDFNKNEIGMHRIDDVITYNMGNTYIRNICNSKGKTRRVNFCTNRKTVSSQSLKNMKKIEKENPKYIVFPAADSLNNMPVFYDETPDPIPDRRVTGNPISIQFNPSKVRNIKINSFKLFEGYKEITNTRLLSKRNDPNKRFSKYEYALFPLDRLKWGKRYTAEIKGIVDGKRFSKRWDFFTKRLNGIIYMVRKPTNYEIWKNKNYFLSFDPNYFGRIHSFRSTCQGIDFVDYNTFKVNIKQNCIVNVPSGTIKIKVK